MAENQQERRQDLRVTFRAVVRLQFAGARNFDRCETGDISVSGVFVEGVTGVECGEKCEVEFKLIGRTSTLVLELSGEVVRVSDAGVALQFLQVDQDSFCHLQNIVYFNYKQAGELEVDSDAAIGAVDDESVYLGLETSRRKSLSIDSGDELAEGDDDGELDTEVAERLSYARDED